MHRAGITETVKAEVSAVKTLAALAARLSLLVKLVAGALVLLTAVREEMKEREIDSDRIDRARHLAEDSRHRMYRRLSRAQEQGARTFLTRTEGLKRTLSTKKMM